MFLRLSQQILLLGKKLVKTMRFECVIEFALFFFFQNFVINRKPFKLVPISNGHNVFHNPFFIFNKDSSLTLTTWKLDFFVSA